MLCVGDVFSRKAFVSVPRSKSDTTSAMQNIFVQERPILIQFDNGTEFLNEKFQNLLAEKNVRLITVDVGDHNRQGIVERFNRTLE